MWGNIATSNGHKKGCKLQDIAPKQISPFQLEKTDELARECVCM